MVTMKLQVRGVNAARPNLFALISLRKMMGDAGIEPATPPGEACALPLTPKIRGGWRYPFDPQ
jgi:hypothetical protein